MRKTHTKNMLSMAPTLNMFNKMSTNREEKVPTLQQNDSTTNTAKNMNIKNNRSISSCTWL